MKIKVSCCAILVLLCFVGREAAAQTVITTCKGIVGKTIVPPNRWFEDAITGGSVTVVRQGAGYDLIIKDALATFTAVEDGARIVKLEGDDDKAFTLALSYPLGQVEVYRFKLDAAGRGVMLYGMFKDAADRAALFSAKCAR